MFLPRGLYVVDVVFPHSTLSLPTSKSEDGFRPAVAVFWTRYNLSNKDASSLNSFLFPVSLRQSMLECSVLNLCIFIAKEHWIKPIINIRCKTDNTENLSAMLYHQQQKYMQLGIVVYVC